MRVAQPMSCLWLLLVLVGIHHVTGVELQSMTAHDDVWDIHSTSDSTETPREDLYSVSHRCEIHVLSGIDPISLFDSSLGYRIVSKPSDPGWYYVFSTQSIMPDFPLPPSREICESFMSISDIDVARIIIQTEAVAFGIPNDPSFPQQWWIQHEGTDLGDYGISSRNASIDANIAWQLGYNGTGQLIVVTDTGIQYDHPDIRDRYRQQYSYSYHLNTNYKIPKDPTPLNLDMDHGTVTTSLAASGQNDSVCISGVAPGADWAGRFLIDASLYTSYSSVATSHALETDCEQVSVHSNSWGYVRCQFGLCSFAVPPSQDSKAIYNCTYKGYHGKGTVYVFASGNSGYDGDYAGLGGFCNLPGVVCVGALAPDGISAYYTTPGTALFITAPGGSTVRDRYGSFGMTAAGNKDTCQDEGMGTSYATPLVTGAIAVMRHANPDLSIWDVMHLLQASAQPVDICKNNKGCTFGGWQQNSAGVWFSQYYGFGNLNVGIGTKMALEWGTNTIPTGTIYGGGKSTTSYAGYSLEKVSENQPGWIFAYGVSNKFAVVESVLVTIEWKSRTSTRRSIAGDLKLSVISPSGTHSTLTGDVKLQAYVISSVYYSYFMNAPLRTNQFWGENGYGVWQVVVSSPEKSSSGQVMSLSNLTIHTHSRSWIWDQSNLRTEKGWAEPVTVIAGTEIPMKLSRNDIYVLNSDDPLIHVYLIDGAGNYNELQQFSWGQELDLNVDLILNVDNIANYCPNCDLTDPKGIPLKLAVCYSQLGTPCTDHSMSFLNAVKDMQYLDLMVVGYTGHTASTPQVIITSPPINDVVVTEEANPTVELDLAWRTGDTGETFSLVVCVDKTRHSSTPGYAMGTTTSIEVGLPAHEGSKVDVFLLLTDTSTSACAFTGSNLLAQSSFYVVRETSRAVVDVRLNITDNVMHLSDVAQVRWSSALVTNADLSSVLYELYVACAESPEIQLLLPSSEYKSCYYRDSAAKIMFYEPDSANMQYCRLAVSPYTGVGCTTDACRSPMFQIIPDAKLKVMSSMTPESGVLSIKRDDTLTLTFDRPEGLHDYLTVYVAPEFALGYYFPYSFNMQFSWSYPVQGNILEIPGEDVHDGYKYLQEYRQECLDYYGDPDYCSAIDWTGKLYLLVRKSNLYTREMDLWESDWYLVLAKDEGGDDDDDGGPSVSEVCAVLFGILLVCALVVAATMWVRLSRGHRVCGRAFSNDGNRHLLTEGAEV